MQSWQPQSGCSESLRSPAMPRHGLSYADAMFMESAGFAARVRAGGDASATKTRFPESKGSDIE